MNEDFISSSIATGIRPPPGGAGGAGGFPSTVSILAAHPSNSPTVSHGPDGDGAGVAGVDRAPPTVNAGRSFRLSLVVVDITVTILWSRGDSSGRVLGVPTLPSKNDPLTQ